MSFNHRLVVDFLFIFCANLMELGNFVQWSSSEIDHGGWTGSADISTKKCNIDIRDNSMTQEEFLERYALDKPVIIRDATNNEKFRDMCRKDSMLKNYSDKRIRLSSANTYSYKKVDVTLKKYVEEIMKPQALEDLGNETLYWFGDNNYTEWEPVFRHYNQPPYRLPQHNGVYSFGLAGAGTGVPFHFHGPGFGEVIFGRKKWFLYPPEHQPEFEPDHSTLHWFVHHYPHLSDEKRPLECTIAPGDAIYFPDRWWHATLNVDTSVFISTFLAPLTGL